MRTVLVQLPWARRRKQTYSGTRPRLRGLVSTTTDKVDGDRYYDES